MVRAEGDRLNTHFRSLPPADGPGRGTATGWPSAPPCEVWEFRDVPARGRRLEPAGRHDACFLPRVGHVTGDIQIHEMAWARTTSCGSSTPASPACARSAATAQLRAALAAAVRHRPGPRGPLPPQRPGHGATAARATSPPWARPTRRPAGGPNKRDGGVLIDVRPARSSLRGLSMPHSPRWHDGRLWVLRVGHAAARLSSTRPPARYEPVAALPGFTRGLDFAGPLAFVGLSQVRETAVFSGIPIAERPVARADLRRLGRGPPDRADGRPAASSRTRCRRSSPCRSCPAGASPT